MANSINDNDKREALRFSWVINNLLKEKDFTTIAAFDGQMPDDHPFKMFIAYALAHAAA